MRTHEAKLKAMANELREHRATHLGKKARGKEADEQRQREAYLEFEVSILAWGLGISQRTRLWIRECMIPKHGPQLGEKSSFSLLGIKAKFHTH